MCLKHNRHLSGFTMIELLVTLVLMSLIVSMVVPQIDAWMNAREQASIKSEMISKLALLPLQASRQGETITVTTPQQLAVTASNVQITMPIKVMDNGFCQGGTFTIRATNRLSRYQVTSPLCEVVAVNEQG